MCDKKVSFGCPLILAESLWLETYPGYQPRWVPIADMPDLELIFCDGCNFVVSEDEYLECPQCGNQMCIYCYESGKVEHKIRFPGDQTGGAVHGKGSDRVPSLGWGAGIKPWLVKIHNAVLFLGCILW